MACRYLSIPEKRRKMHTGWCTISIFLNDLLKSYHRLPFIACLLRL
jgi:hypothetical protein